MGETGDEAFFLRGKGIGGKTARWAKRKMGKRKDGRLCYTEEGYKNAGEGLPWPP